MMTRNPMTRNTFALVTLWILLVSAGWAGAQEQEENVDDVLTTATPEEVGEQASLALTRLREIVEEAKGYEERMLSASAEDSLVFRLRLNKAREKFIETLYQLADLVVASKDDAEHHELRDRAEVVFAEVTPAIWELIDKLSAEIDLLRAKRMSIPAAERSALEDNIRLLSTRLDQYYQTGGDQVEKLELLGQDTAEPKAVFSGMLHRRAGDLSGRLQLATLRINELGSRLKDFPGDADITALLLAARKDLETCVTSQELVLNLMDALKLPTKGYRAELVTTTQDLASGLLDHRVASTLIKRAWDGMVNWVVTKGPGMLVQVLLFLAIIVAGRFLSKLVGKAVEKSMNRAKLNISQLLKRMIVNGVVNTVMGLAFLVALAQLGISLGPLLAGFGVVGFILGFAMQDSLSNLAAGMMILINRPYDVGDLVEISGVFGKVENMSMVSTSILTLDNQKLVVPNSKIWGDVIKNVTDQHIRRVDMVFGISYNDDIPNAERVLNEILDQHEMVLNKPEPMVKVHTLGESSVDFIVRPWVKTDDYWDVYWDVTRTVKMRFDAERISIPFPQRDVHLIPVQPDAPEEA